jgi:hypothetical protein
MGYGSWIAICMGYASWFAICMGYGSWIAICTWVLAESESNHARDWHGHLSSRSWPRGGDSFGIGRHLHYQILDDVFTCFAMLAAWVLMRSQEAQAQKNIQIG